MSKSNSSGGEKFDERQFIPSEGDQMYSVSVVLVPWTVGRDAVGIEDIEFPKGTIVSGFPVNPNGQPDEVILKTIFDRAIPMAALRLMQWVKTHGLPTGDGFTMPDDFSVGGTD